MVSFCGILLPDFGQVTTFFAIMRERNDLRLEGLMLRIL